MTDHGPRTDPAKPPPGRMSEAEFRSLHERLRSQVPWGPDDRRGALNYLTSAALLAAVGEVRQGRTVSLAAPIETGVMPFTKLTEACEAASRWSFLCIITPLRLPGGTGSPVNPIAVL